MKTKILLVVGFITFLGMAQEAQDSIRPKKNIIKTNLTSIPFRNYQLTYERSLAKWFSISATYGMMPEGKIPFLDKFVTDEDLEDISDIEDIQLKSNSVTIETRFYLGKGYGKGFYFAPYYRYSTFELDNLTVNYPISIEEQPEYDIPLAISGKTTSNNLGLMIGAQKVFGKTQNWVFDTWILGAHYGMAKGDLAGIAPRPLTEEEQQIIQQDIIDEDIPLVEYEVNVNENGANITLDGPWAGVRAGFSIGYRF